MLKPKIDHFKDDSNIVKYRVQEKEEGLSIYQLLYEQLQISNNLLRKLRKNYRLRLNKRFIDYNTIVKSGDLLELNLNFSEKMDFIPEAMHLDIIYEDQNLLAINKPAGILVHPTAKQRTNTLANGVLFHLIKQNNYNLFRAIHRLDRNTSGLILIAKNQYAHNYLTKQFMHQKVHREYLALVAGVVEPNSGTINAPIGRVEGSIIERKIDLLSGKEAITHFFVLERFAQATLIRLSLETGRTHQIRVHLSHIGHPLVGDSLYRKNNSLINRHALHAAEITCILPFTHEMKTFRAPLAIDISSQLSEFKHS